jgi:hypothetical protein
MDIIIFSILTNFLYFCSGGLFFLSYKKYDFHSQFYVYFVGVSFISFISLLLNFFTPLTTSINSILYLLITTAFIIKRKFNFNQKEIKFLAISSFLTFLLIICSTINRPDAGLYHLPYISTINENKIIFGLSNIHFRYGHISILQYLSAINKNYLFSENGISIPLASIVSFFYVYFFYDVWKVASKKEIPNLSNFFSLFILIYITFKIARYSDFGNDAVGHLSFFYLISYLLKNNIKFVNFNKILLISVFAFINKPTLGIIFIAPISIFFFQNIYNSRKIFYSLFSLPTLLLSFWLIKNIIVSGCLVYPIKMSCIDNLPWTNNQQIIDVNLETNAWSKGWPDRIDKNISMQEFSKNFNWFNTWRKNHLIYILSILIPYILVLCLIILYIKINFKTKIVKINNDFKTVLFLCIIISVLGCCFFFFLFPLYRYGYSYIISLVSILFILLIKNKASNKNNFVIFKFILVSCFIIIAAKQTIKIYKNSSSALWPNIYTLDSHGKIYPKTKIKINNGFFYYLADKGDQLCMYSKSPCTTYPVKNIKYSLKKTYTFLTLN